MKNRAKCKLCKKVIESFHEFDYVSCSCGEISISGGSYKYECYANDFSNFLRVDDENNEVIVKVENQIEMKKDEFKAMPTREELLKVLDEMISNIENLPKHVMSSPISHYDLCSALILISSIMKTR